MWFIEKVGGLGGESRVACNMYLFCPVSAFVGLFLSGLSRESVVSETSRESK